VTVDWHIVLAALGVGALLEFVSILKILRMADAEDTADAQRRALDEQPSEIIVVPAHRVSTMTDEQAA
jgi:hypothetical protein